MGAFSLLYNADIRPNNSSSYPSLSRSIWYDEKLHDGHMSSMSKGLIMAQLTLTRACGTWSTPRPQGILQGTPQGIVQGTVREIPNGIPQGIPRGSPRGYPRCTLEEPRNMFFTCL